MTAGLVATRRALPGYALRVLLGAAIVGLLLTVLSAWVTGPLWPALAIVAAVLVPVFPASPAPSAFGVLAVAALVVGDPGFGVRLVVAGSLLHTVHVLAGLAEAVPARALVELPALQPMLLRWAATQAVTVPILAALAAVLD